MQALLIRWGLVALLALGAFSAAYVKWEAIKDGIWQQCVNDVKIKTLEAEKADLERAFAEAKAETERRKAAIDAAEKRVSETEKTAKEIRDAAPDANAHVFAADDCWLLRLCGKAR